MRRDPSFLKDILAACRKIETIVAGTSEEAFHKSEILPAAVLHHLTVIGEAIARLSNELKERHPEVPWALITAVRNRIVYAYFDLDWPILWVAAANDVPELSRKVRDILCVEFLNSSPNDDVARYAPTPSATTMMRALWLPGSGRQACSI